MTCPMCDAITVAGVVILVKATFSSERDTLIARTQIGLKAAHKRGRTGGRPKMMSDVQIASAKNMFANGTTAIDIATAFKVSVPPPCRRQPQWRL